MVVRDEEEIWGYGRGEEDRNEWRELGGVRRGRVESRTRRKLVLIDRFLPWVVIKYRFMKV